MRALIALQAAFCFVVLFAAGLFVATFDIVNPMNEPSTLWDQVADHVRRMPGIQAVAYADWPLLDGYGFKTTAISINQRRTSLGSSGLVHERLSGLARHHEDPLHYR